MKLKVTRYSLEVIPESPQDEAYIEEVLGLRAEGACVVLVRKNNSGVSSISCLEAKKALSYEELKARLEEGAPKYEKPPEFIPAPFHTEPQTSDPVWKIVKIGDPILTPPLIVTTCDSKEGETK